MYVSPALTAINSPFLSKSNTGLGNTLFQIAATYGIAKKTGRVPMWNNVLKLSDLLHNKFGYNHKDTIFRNVLTCKNVPFEQLNIIGGPDNQKAYDNSLVPFIVSSNKNIELLGYLENTNYFNEYKQEIVELFSPDENSLNIIKEAFPILFDDSYTTIAIHFRGNEYLMLEEKPSYIYLKTIITHIKSIIENPIFLLFTDDFTNFDFSVLDEVDYIKMDNKNNIINIDYIYLWSFSLCKHAIVSHSTFSFWGAYLNKRSDSTFYVGYSIERPWHKSINVSHI